MAAGRLHALLGGLFKRAAVRAPGGLAPGTRVRLTMPIASSHRVWIPVGATGIVVGWDNHGRRASVELDLPRTVVSVPWPWVETLPPGPAGPAPAGTAGPAAGPTA